MNEKMKRELIISGVMVCLLVMTLILWRDNFKFHTYIQTADYQYCFQGENDDLMINGYEFYQDKIGRQHGGARIASKTPNLFLSGDVFTLTFQVKKNESTYEYSHQYNIQMSDEVFYLSLDKTAEKLKSEYFEDAKMLISIQRGDEKVYEKSIPVKSENLTVYNGGNKNYTIQNVYITKSWIKTGNLSSKQKNIAKKYPFMSIDYIYLKDKGNVEDINDYERFIHLKGQTKDFIDGKIHQTAIYDDSGSLLDKTFKCVITFSKNEDLSKPFIFELDLSGNIKVGD